MAAAVKHSSITNRDITKLSVYALIIIIVALTFIILKPILLSIVFGLILAFMLNPIYKKIYAIFREKNTSAMAICVLLLLVVFIPIWFLFFSNYFL